MPKAGSWDILCKLSQKVIERDNLSQEYSDRLSFEIKEIEKQGANRYWLGLFNSRKKFDTNKNGLVLPFLLGITPIDPIKEGKKHIVKYHPDFPDIDIDFLPEAREHVNKYAETKYGSDYVCAVGMWIRYKARLALQDAATALGVPRSEVIALCKNLPKEFDEMPFDEAINEFENLASFAEVYPELCRLAYGMSGKIKAQSKHAGGLIISSVPIKDYVPMIYSGTKGKKYWASAWTEGMAETQLSKVGFVKFDILGLRNIGYMWHCKRMIKKHRGISISFDDIDPEENRVGYITYPDGTKKDIKLDDKATLNKADKLNLISIFQFQNDFQMSVVEKGGVKSFMDLVIYTSLGRPGPLPMIDVYIKNRDDKSQSWRNGTHKIMQDILGETHGVLTFQEQLLRTWTELCGFTMPEAEAAQKAVKKKRIKILEEIGPKVIEGAAREIGQKAAEELWDKMVSFGRYCFNKCLSYDTILIDPTTGEPALIEELYFNKRPFKLRAYDGTTAFIDDIVDIHYSGKQEVFEVEFSHGLKQMITCNHKFMNELGEMEEISSLIKTNHAIKYIRDGVTDVSQAKFTTRESDCRRLSEWNDLQADNKSPWDQSKPRNHNTSNKEVWSQAQISNESNKYCSARLLREYKLTGKSLLARDVNRRWVYSRGKRICELAASLQGPVVSRTIWEGFEIAKKNIDLSQKKQGTKDFYTSSTNSEQQKDGVRSKTSWCWTKEVYQRNDSKYTVHITPIERSDGRGWMYYGQLKRLSDDQDWIELCLLESTKNHFSFRMWGKTLKDYQISEQFLCDLLDWLIPDTSDSEVSLSRCNEISSEEEANGRCNIVSFKSLGVKRTYSPEMKSSYHNYMITPKKYETIHANSHAVGYIIISYCCLWLKTHYPAEWWATALSFCPQEKSIRFMGAARSEDIKFGSIDVNNLEVNFTVQGDRVLPGLSRVKGIGPNKAEEVVKEAAKEPFTSIDHFVARCGKSKTILERLIKLGGFDLIHENRLAIWMWYIYKYSSGPDRTKMRALLNYCYRWPDDKIFEERQRQLTEYKRLYPNRTKIPDKIAGWFPSAPYSDPSPFDIELELTDEQKKSVKKIRLKFEQVLALFPNDFSIEEKLEAEKLYFGYYWSSPLDMFVHNENTSIKYAKTNGVLEAVIEEIHTRTSIRGEFLTLNVNDGVGTAKVNVWGGEVSINDEEIFRTGTGIRAEVNWSDQYKSFSVKNRSIIIPLDYVESNNELSLDNEEDYAEVNTLFGEEYV
jgi:hypothetical protein